MVSSRTKSLIQSGVLILGFLAYGVVGIASMAYPYDLGLYEGVVFMPALRLLQGHVTFGAEAALQPPFSFPLYGPLYYMGLGAVLKLTGVAFWPGRLLSFVCGLCLAALVHRHARRSGLDFKESLLLANVFLMVPSAWTFFTLQRVDAPSLLLAALGSMLMLERRGPRVAVLGGILFALAALTKPAVCGLFLGSVALRVFERRRVEAALCALSACATFFGVVEGLSALGLGNYFFNLFASLDGQATIASVENVVRSVGGSPVFFVLVTFGLLDLGWRIQGRKPAHESGPIWLTLASLVSGAALSAHTGSGGNYLLESLFALCLLVSSSLGRGMLSQERAAKGLAELVLVAAFVSESLVFHGGFIRGRFLLPSKKKPVYEAIVKELGKLRPGAVVVSDLPDLAYRAGLETWFNDIPQYDAGPDYVHAELTRALAGGEVAAILTYGQRPTPGYVGMPLPSPAPDSFGRIGPDPGPFLYVLQPRSQTDSNPARP